MCVVIGIVIGFKTPIIGILIFLIGLALATIQNAVELNFAARNYRAITTFGHITIGDRKELPPLKCVSVFRTKIISSLYGRSGASVSTEQYIFQVNLITVLNQRIKIFDGEEEVEAIELAKMAVKDSGVEVWDATGKKGRWLLEE